MDISLALKRFQSLQNNTKKSDFIWKPEKGQSIIRIVPYKFNKDNPFIELFFHYNINNKSYLSPVSFGRPDPIVEFADKLKRTGDKDDWKAGKNMEPKLRTFAPVIVRGKEHEGVKFWGFGKTVYQDILAYIADPDYGDITDPLNGRDIVLEVSQEAGKTYPTTTIRIKPKESKISEDVELVKKIVQDQKDITELYEEMSYTELKSVLENWLNPSSEKPSKAADTVVQELAKPTSERKQTADTEDEDDGPGDLPWEKPAQKTQSVKDEVASAFDDLFN
jgi:hypothetical protein